ncbi:MAG: carboxypeptidase-like regulatory domain-containing protein, partial [Planctomycetota bacterium]
MRKIAFGVVVFVFIAGLMLLSRRYAARAALNPEAAASSQTPSEAGEIADLNTPREEERAEAQPVPKEVAALTQEAAGASGSLLCIVHGTLADESGVPLEGVLVRLQAHKVWSSEVDVPRLEHEQKYKLVGFEQFTDAAGAFRFEAPPPTVSITWMDIEPTRFFDSRRITFNSSQARFEPSLTAGERDLGEIRLATTGAISGRVTAEDGTPLADVRMGVGPDPTTTYGKNARTGPDGRYVLGHAPIGSYCITASLKGYLSGVLQPITVESQRDTTQIDFTLKEAPTLRGRVVDESGRALEGVRLFGWPKSSGSGAGATTEYDGRFTVSLPQEEPYSLEATLKGHAKWESEEGLYFEPGTADLEIVLESIPLTRFAVIDADSGNPVQKFGINILLDNGSEAPQRVYTERRPPRVLAHENGVAEVTAREGFDVYVIAAPGYGLAVGEVAFDDPATPVQTIRLVPGATVSGRILREGKPVPGVTIQLVRGNSFFGGEFTPEANTQVIRQTDSEGRFVAIGLSAGKYRFRATPVAGALLELPTFPLELRETKDLGD